MQNNPLALIETSDVKTAADVSGRARITRSVAASGFSVRAARLAAAAVLLASDTVALTLSAVIAYLSWAGPVLGQSPAVYTALRPALLLFLIAYVTGGLYPGFGIGAVETLRRLSLRTAAGFFLLAAMTFAIKLPDVYSRVTFGIALVCALVLVPVLRVVVLSLVRRFHWWGEPVLVIGAGRLAEKTVSILRAARVLGYRPIIDPTRDVDDTGGRVVISDAVSAAAWAHRGVQTVLIAEDASSLPGETIALLQQHFRRVIVVRGYEEVPVEHVSVRNFGGVLGLEFKNQLLLRRNRMVKRCFDLAVSLPMAIITFPILMIATALVKIIDRGPALYGQEREGFHGQMFKVWKVRTMYVDAEERLARYLRENESARAEWDRTYKLRRDPRILPGVGSVIRRFSIDELPQLWQVSVGTMSLVGPRPLPKYHIERFDDEFRRLRRRVRPGVTGLWQVTARSDSDLGTQKTLDIYYVRNWSLWLDIYLFVRTFGAVVTARGAY